MAAGQTRSAVLRLTEAGKMRLDVDACSTMMMQFSKLTQKFHADLTADQ